MLIGIVRTSTFDQEASFEGQHKQLSEAGCEKVFSERVSAVGPRPELDKAMEFAREGDTIVCTSLCRLARSVAHLMRILDDLERNSKSAAASRWCGAFSTSCHCAETVAPILALRTTKNCRNHARFHFS